MSNPGQVSYWIDSDRSLVRVELCGPVTVDQILRFLEDVMADPLYERTYGGLIDLRDFTGELTGGDLRTIAHAIRQNPGAPGARRAIVVHDDLQFGIGRMMESLTFLAPVIYHAFRAEEAAIAWLTERGPLR